MKGWATNEKITPAPAIAPTDGRGKNDTRRANETWRVGKIAPFGVEFLGVAHS